MKILAISKIEQVRQEIITQILCGTLQPGQRLYEAQLSNELGVSQATVNAALQDLHNQGLVRKVLNRSTNVIKYSWEDVKNLFSVRLVLEPAASEALANAWSGEAEACLLEYVERLRRAAQTTDVAKWCIADYQFHQEIYRLSGNHFLIQAGQAIAAAPFAYILCGHVRALATDYSAMAEEHMDMIAAIREGPETAGRVTRARVLEWFRHSEMVLQSAANGGPVAA